MSAIISALDNHTSQQLGENGHVEYGWSNNIQEQIMQFSFQVVRAQQEDLENLKEKLTEILSHLKYKLTSSNIIDKQVAKDHLTILYKIIGQTRDLIDGKGEYELSYMMVRVWYDFYPELATFALKCMVDLDDSHQYGSWKDIKYFCDYCKRQNLELKHPLIQYAIKLLNDQIVKDVNSLASNEKISLVAKWAPREKSKFNWIYQELATQYFANYLDTAIGFDKYEKAVLKAKTDYRKLLAKLNKVIDTVQIKQCGKEWSEINFGKVTSISLSKQKKAFLNVKKNGETRFENDTDRIECAEHFKAHIQKAVNGEIEMKGKRVGMADFTKQARDLIHNNNSSSQLEKDLLNSQWRDSSSLTGDLDNIIAMVDVSGSMTVDDAMNVAVALGIRVAEKSKLGKRVMTFSAVPRWINLEPYNNFVDQVKAVESGTIGLNTNFALALNLILDTIVENKMDPSDVENMILAIFSDMQIDEADNIKDEYLNKVDRVNKENLHKPVENSNWGDEPYWGGEPQQENSNYMTPSQRRDSMYAEIAVKYANAGMLVHGKPYKPPHILFWNLRTTQGFPVLSYEKNTSMMSGYSPALLNEFCNKGVDALKECTPWSVLISSLEKERYEVLTNKLNEEIVV